LVTNKRQVVYISKKRANGPDITINSLLVSLSGYVQTRAAVTQLE